MSDYNGTNIQTKITKILNLFLGINESFNNTNNDFNNVEKKKKRKKNKNKNSEREI